MIVYRLKHGKSLNITVTTKDNENAVLSGSEIIEPKPQGFGDEETIIKHEVVDALNYILHTYDDALRRLAQ